MNHRAPKEIFSEEMLEGEFPSKRSKIWKAANPWIKGVTATLVVLSLVYYPAIYHALFYGRTPTSIKQEKISSTLDAQEINLPLNIILISNNGSYGSRRSEENVRKLVENASHIWSQANISLRITKISVISKSDPEVSLFFRDPATFAVGLRDYDPHLINVILLAKLNGINGIASPAVNTVAVADYTSVYDFRALAHEVGHILSLDHTDEGSNRLMSPGANGLSLTMDEITSARQAAKKF